MAEVVNISEFERKKRVTVDIEFPRSPSEFVTRLEQVGQVGRWGMVSDIASNGRWFATFRPSNIAVSRLVFFDGDVPLVRLSKMDFELERLPERGLLWDPSLYPDNPYMPFEDKTFLDRLYHVISGVRLLPVLAGGGRRDPGAHVSS